MEQVMFKDRKHKECYMRLLKQVPKEDVYHRALFYTLSMSPDIRAHIKRVYDADEDFIKPECLEEGWQTSGSLRIIRLAFNLWGNWNDGYVTPSDVFDSGENAPYMLEAIKLRFPASFREINYHELETRLSER